MASQGIREIAIFGIGAPSQRRKVAEAIWSRTDHALFLDPDMKPMDQEQGRNGSPIHTTQIDGRRTAVVRPETCTNCGRCIRSCPSGAIRKVEGRMQVDSRLCTACGACVDACPRQGIGLDGSPLAWLQISATTNGRLVHGRLAEGVQASPEFVKRLLERSRVEVRLYGMETLVIDVPWNEGPLFEFLSASTGQRIVVVDPHSTEAMETAMRNLTFSSEAPTRLAIPTDDEVGYRFLTNDESHGRSRSRI